MTDSIPCTRCGGTGIEPGSGGGGYDDTPITSRKPKLYLPLEESGGDPADAAGAGYIGRISIEGAALSYRMPTAKGFGIHLARDSYIKIEHDSVFITNGAGQSDTHVESEVTFSIHCAFPSAPEDDWTIFSKSDNDNDLSPSVSLRVHASGAVELNVREHKYRPEVRMRTPDGIVTAGSEHHFTVSLGYEGAWFTVDGQPAELGVKNTLAWWGLDHRHNGVEEGGQAVSTRVTNTSAIRIGRTGDQNSSADIVVTKFAVFYEGVTRTTIRQKTKGLTFIDTEQLAGFGARHPMADPRFMLADASPPAGTNTIQEAIDACTPNGTVRLSGNYTQTKDLVLKRGVRITSRDSAKIVFTDDAKLTSWWPKEMPSLGNCGALMSGAQTYSCDNGLSLDAVFLVIDKQPLGSLYKVTGVHNEDAKKSDLIPIQARSDTAVRFARAPFFNYPAGSRLATVGYETTPDVQIDGRITLTKNGGTKDSPLVTLHALRRVRLHGITIHQTTKKTPNLLACMLYGCVEVQINGCSVVTDSPQGSSPHYHPYALKFAGCANYDVFNHVGHSHGWHAVDNECENCHDTWKMHEAVPDAHYGGQFGDIRNGRLSSTTNNFPCITHTASQIRMLDLWFTSGGGTATDGYGHNIEFIEAAAGGKNTQLSCSRGVGGTRIWHCNFNNKLGNWGQGDYGMTKCSYGDLHYQSPVQKSTFSPVPHDGSNEFKDVDKAERGFPF